MSIIIFFNQDMDQESVRDYLNEVQLTTWLMNSGVFISRCKNVTSTHGKHGFLEDKHCFLCDNNKDKTGFRNGRHASTRSHTQTHTHTHWGGWVKRCVPQCGLAAGESLLLDLTCLKPVAVPPETERHMEQGIWYNINITPLFIT